ncbi:formate dehydrogenase accessory sulfurtransferase FdhD [Comamonas sp. 26]|uniref:formate dehydrogenase accessory sulfurtransferase FdhD n=1 Tax=Comamonas sp. 26 TaxID=2035201 RepID=UPI000C17FE6F|nr:formate dehydrogenase accessory sulfurtransferase FdhD [Comamonas sp. 26]PIG07639.1 FdhD protein [Comamonas sp. 26]
MTDSACPIPAATCIEPLQKQAVTFFNAGRAEPQERVLAAEVPIALVFNGISHAVMMGSPGDVEDFALGFALTEGIIDSAADCYSIEAQLVSATAAGLPEGMDGQEVQLDIASRCFARLKDKRRSITGRTGCGVCGVESFAALDLSFDALPAHDWLARVDAATVLKAIDALPPHQILNAEAGAIHAAGWATLSGEITDVLEDVGRHNALDKLIGRLARTGRLGEAGFVVLSSRGSHELVRKCAKVGIAALATISAPTAMGVRMAELTGLRFWGLCRPPKAVLYAGDGKA